MLPYQLVVFDMAGTTVQDNHEVEDCFYEAAVQTGLEATRSRINAMHGIPKKIVIETLWDEYIGKNHPEFDSKVEATFAAFKTILETHYLTHPVRPTIAAIETFAWLKSQGVKIALNTGFYREVVNIILQRLGWDHNLGENYIGNEDSIIDLSLTPSETGGKGRPHPDMILKAMQVFGIDDPKKVVKIGDTPSDLQEGKLAGVGLNLAVTSGSHTREELEVWENDGLMDSLAELPALMLEKSAILNAG
jgi:phosphonatase-like hydrolase